jgi:hypothetical protein
MPSRLETAVFEAMQEDNPVAIYKKVIPAKVRVWILNPFSGEAQEEILSGPPNSEGSFVKLWSTVEDQFFRRMNQAHLKSGYVIPASITKKGTPKVETEVENPNTYSDNKLEEILNSRFLKFQSEIDKMTSEAPLIRLIELEESGRGSEKILEHLKSKLSEIQIPED